MADHSVLVPLTLSELERWDASDQILQADLISLITFIPSVWNNQILQDNAREGRISRSATPLPQGAGSQCCPILGIPSYSCTH